MSFIYFYNGKAVNPNEINANFEHVALGTRLPLANSLTMAATTGVNDLGSATYKWSNVYCNNLNVNSTTSGNIYITATSQIGLRIAGNIIQATTTAQYIKSGATTTMFTNSGEPIKSTAVNFVLAPTTTFDVVHGISGMPEKLVSCYPFGAVASSVTTQQLQRFAIPDGNVLKYLLIEVLSTTVRVEINSAPPTATTANTVTLYMEYLT